MKKLPFGAQTKRQGEPQAGEHPIVTVGLTGRVLSSSPIRSLFRSLRPDRVQVRSLLPFFLFVHHTLGFGAE
jgi:hypothetical protein